LINANPKFDVVIVGAGPAGALLGYHLARKSIKVLIIEKKRQPRYKACGGGLTRRAVESLPFDISSVVEQQTHTAHMLFQNKPLFTATFDEPVITMVMRDRFDSFIVEKAVSRGAMIQDRTSFRAVYGNYGNLTVETSKGNIKTKIVAGADGVISRVGKALNLRVQNVLMTAMEGELYPESPFDFERFKGASHYDFGVIPKGYGWVFPKKDHLSVGVGTFSPRIRGWKHYFDAYLKLKGLVSISKIHPFKGHLIPVRPKKNNTLSCPEGLLVGDAAGFADPLTGEGLFFAIHGAKIASQTIFNSLDSGLQTMAGYTKSMNNEFFKDLACAGYMAHMIYSFPTLGRKILLTHSEDLAARQLAVVCGQTSYASVFRSLLLKMMNPVTFLSVCIK